MAARGGFPRNEGDWICPEPKCGNSNFARRDKCNRCGTEKPRTGLSSGKVKMGGLELGKQMAEKSKGLFSADDWQCSQCGNVNWARRNTCNLCNQPKVGKVEERTGFGGGFMERDENPEKIERNSDDEEYDEYGRKKKKFRGKSTDADPYKKSAGSEEYNPEPQIDEEEEEDDDEEEDSDDEDLSKYAFDSDDASDAKKDSKPPSKSSSSRRHSDSESSRSSRSSRSRDSRSRSRSNRDSRARSSSRSSYSSRSSSRSRSRSRSPIHKRK